jgi:hypothetical protein
MKTLMAVTMFMVLAFTLSAQEKKLPVNTA